MKKQTNEALAFTSTVKGWERAFDLAVRVFVSTFSAMAVCLVYMDAFGIRLISQKVVTILLVTVGFAFFWQLIFASRKKTVAALAILIFEAVLFPHDIVGGAACLWNSVMKTIAAGGFVTLPTVMSWSQFPEYGAVYIIAFVSVLVFSVSVRKRVSVSACLIYMAFVFSPVLVYNLADLGRGTVMTVCAVAMLAAMGISERKSGVPIRSGHAALGALVLSLVLSLIVSATVSGAFGDIPFISEKIDDIRTKFVSVLSVGNGGTEDDPTFRDTTATERKYKNIKVLSCYADADYPIYLRSWVGSVYDHGKWLTEEAAGVEGVPDVMKGERCLADEYNIVYGKSPDGISAAETLGLRRENVRVVLDRVPKLLPIPRMQVSGLSFDTVGMTVNIPDSGMFELKGFEDGTAYNVTALVPAYRSGAVEEYMRSFAEYYYGVTHRIPYKPSYSESLTLTKDTLPTVPDNVYSRYDKYDRQTVAGIIEKMTESPELSEYFSISSLPYSSAFGVNVSGRWYYISEETRKLNADAIVKAVCEYLSRNYSYTLSPAAPTVTDPMDEFLNVSGEGYCVQFATATTLILRQLGFEARYAEGYAATEFKPTADGKYLCYVKDSDAHAWTEVWINGIGWLPYETTPPYSEMMSRTAPDTAPSDVTAPAPLDTDAGNTDTSDVTEPPEDTDAHTEPPTPATTDGMTETGNGSSLLPLLIAAGAVIVITLAVIAILKRSENKTKKRLSLLHRAENCRDMPPAELEKLAASVAAELLSALTAYGVRRGECEMPTEFGKRADKVLSRLSPPVVPSRCVEAVSALVYGGTVTVHGVRDCARLALFLAENSKNQLGTADYLVKRYIFAEI